MTKIKLNNIYIYIILLSLVGFIYTQYIHYNIEGFKNDLSEIPFYIPRKNNSNFRFDVPLVIYHS